MICDMIKSLREDAGFSQSELAKKLDVTRSSVNAWEMGLSTPTTHYIVELAKLFHISTDYLLGLEKERTVILDDYTKTEIELIYGLLKYFDEQKNLK
ncbi:MAG: helix-turn-helix transcriptional regulator [Clostridia bacterium]|nr:helix-turn-helix transcriptional regulator [Clostridia bacterium]